VKKYFFNILNKSVGILLRRSQYIKNKTFNLWRGARKMPEKIKEKEGVLPFA
jgi:hypothetical protein